MRFILALFILITGGCGPVGVIPASALFFSEKKEKKETLCNLHIFCNPQDGGIVKVIPEGKIYLQGTLITVTACPNTGYIFKKWSGDINSTDNPFEFKMDCSKKIIANFEYQLFPPNWGKINSLNYPSARIHHAMAYDIDRKVVVLFGGWNGTTCLGDIWEWNGIDWIQKVPVGADLPSARQCSVMAYDAVNNVVVLFGGHDGNCCSDIWEWDGTDWTQLFPANNPPARSGHAMAYDSVNEVIVLFGGDDSGRFDDTWEWDGIDWTQKFPTNNPSLRCGHAITYDSFYKKIVLFGGWNSGPCLDDTWEWDGIDWTQKFPLNSPSKRSYPAITYNTESKTSFLFGGWNGTNCLRDIWEWNGTDWTQKFPDNSPELRYGHTMVYDSNRNVIVLFGGDNHSGVYYNDTWEYK